jgi:cell division septation protein DedD
VRRALALSLLLSGAAYGVDVGLPDPKAQYERAKAQEDLALAGEGYRALIAQDPRGPWGNLALLELGKQEYALGHNEAAIIFLGRADEAQLEGENKGQLYYWRAQSRLVLKGFERAQGDFESFIRLFPDHALADSARLAVADCDAVLKNYEAALKGYQKLYQAPASSVAPQAMLQAAGLHLKAKQSAEAREVLLKLAESYPESLEAGRARDLLKDMPALAAAPSPVSPAAASPGKAVFSIQVGAFTSHAGASKLFAKLRKKRYSVRLEKKVLEDDVLHILQIGRYASKDQALKAAERIMKKEKLPARVVEIQKAL